MTMLLIRRSEAPKEYLKLSLPRRKSYFVRPFSIAQRMLWVWSTRPGGGSSQDRFLAPTK
jgi:hypothetical protein